MADLQSLLGDTKAAGAQPTFTWRGKEYRLHARKIGMMAAFVKFAKDTYAAELKEDRERWGWTEAKWEAKQAEYEERCASGWFDFYQPYATKLRESEAGAMHMLRLTLGEQVQDLSDAEFAIMSIECTEDIKQATTQYQAIIDEMYRLAGFKEVTDKDGQKRQEGGDPKALRRMMVEAGLV